MPFANLPSRLPVRKKTKLTSLVAAWGIYGEDENLTVGLSGSAIHTHQVRQVQAGGPIYQRWRWDEAKPQTVEREGWQVAVRNDDRVVMRLDGHLETEQPSRFLICDDVKPIRELKGPPISWKSEPQIAFVHQRLVIGASFNRVEVIDIDRGDSAHSIDPGVPLREFDPGASSFSAMPDHQIAVSTSREIKMFDLFTGEGLGEVRVAEDLKPGRVTASPDGTRLLVAFSRKEQDVSGGTGWLVLDARTGRELARLDQQAWFTGGAAFFDGGRRIATRSTAGTLRLVDATSFELLEELKIDRSTDYGTEPPIAWDDHRALVVPSRDGQVYVLSIAGAFVDAGAQPIAKINAAYESEQKLRKLRRLPPLPPLE